MALILMASATVFLRRIFRVANNHRLVWTGVTGHAYLWLDPGHMIGLAAFLAMATETARDKSMFRVTISACHCSMLAGEILQSLRRRTVAV